MNVYLSTKNRRFIAVNSLSAVQYLNNFNFSNKELQSTIVDFTVHQVDIIRSENIVGGFKTYCVIISNSRYTASYRRYWDSNGNDEI